MSILRQASVLGPILLTALCGCQPVPTGPAMDAATGPAARFDSLPGWPADHVADAMPALVRGCDRLALTPPDQVLGGSGAIARRAGQAAQWSAVCTAARAVPPGNEPAARAFLQARFDLYPLVDPARPAGLFTGYYEPEVQGSREKTRRFHVPVMTRPADLAEQTDADGTRHYGRLQDGALVPYYTRAEIDRGALSRQRLDLLYLQSPVDLFFLQIQGAGRIDLPNGHVVRVGYAGRSGQPYVAIGKVLADRRAIPAGQVSAQTIRDWLESNPREAQAMMEQDPAYTFFHEVPNLPPDQGPLGTLGVPLTPLRSVAVDVHSIPLGAPLWIATVNPDGSSLDRLMLAQDLGSGVQGAVRADIFYGWGAAAEDQAGRMQAPGKAWLLLPKPVQDAAPAS